ncbi:MAG: alanine--tRNA ligase-related protein, partial [Patescibacteria group bacterium]|nr:alanine--tRNA ligase-related protein [Patescibacteria group bacterium]
MAQYPGMLVHDIKSALLNFHRDKFKVFSSFPLLSSDRTVMFTNATITPFKDMFLGIIPAENYAIVQQCFRYGGTTEIDCFGNNPYSLTAFEMFGSGLFNSNLVDSVSYLIEMLDL